MITVDQVRQLAQAAHAGQVDKMGRDYYQAHLLPIAAALVEHGPEAEMAGLLHDVLEDTDVTATELARRGVPDDVIRAVVSVTRRDDEPYEGLIVRAAADPLGVLVKLADNAHNLRSNSELAAVDPDKAAELLARYRAARVVLLDGARRHHT